LATVEPVDEVPTREPLTTIDVSPTTPRGLTVFVPPLPIDLAVGAETAHDGHADDYGAGDEAAGDGGELGGDAAIAANFVVAVYTQRFDDPADARIRRLTQLVVDANTTVASVPTLEDGDIATWPIITAVTRSGAGWWRVRATLKTTRHDQHGPTSEPHVVEVHITGGLVDAWDSR
jgi:hypothetical protein